MPSLSLGRVEREISCGLGVLASLGRIFVHLDHWSRCVHFVCEVDSALVMAFGYSIEVGLNMLYMYIGVMHSFRVNICTRKLKQPAVAFMLCSTSSHYVICVSA